MQLKTKKDFFMTNPVGDKPPDPYEHYLFEAIQREKKAKEQRQEAPDSHTPFWLSFLLLLQKWTGLFLQKDLKKVIFQPNEHKIRNHLSLFQEALEILKKEDRSQDSKFLNYLSELWLKLLDDSLRYKRESPTFIQFKILIQKIQSYPRNQEHTLGYYLVEHAGKKWLPFPYMEMIQRLHSEYLKNPAESHLEEWTFQLREISSLLKR